MRFTFSLCTMLPLNASQVDNGDFLSRNRKLQVLLQIVVPRFNLSRRIEQWSRGTWNIVEVQVGRDTVGLCIQRHVLWSWQYVDADSSSPWLSFSVMGYSRWRDVDRGISDSGKKIAGLTNTLVKMRYEQWLQVSYLSWAQGSYERWKPNYPL
jgi:hypothetical protein